MSAAHSDALVFFGATGDLTHKKILPSLRAMLKRAWEDYVEGGPTEVDPSVAPPGGWQNPTVRSP
jgi:hypothetical protein